MKGLDITGKKEEGATEKTSSQKPPTLDTVHNLLFFLLAPWNCSTPSYRFAWKQENK